MHCVPGLVCRFLCALGTNLFSGRQTLTERFGRDDVWRELTKRSSFLSELESIDFSSEELLERISEKMEGAAKVTSYDSETGIVELTVTPYVEVNSLEVEYQEASSEEKGKVSMQLREGTAKTYDGRLDISKWKSTDGEIRISGTMPDGTLLENVSSADLKDLIEEAE